MSPEQVAGKPVDKRADIWAFGVVLFEMLTGQRLFTGETVSHVLAKVLERDLDMSVLPTGTPTSITALLGRCLERKPRRRLGNFGEALVHIEDAATAPTEDLPATTAPPIESAEPQTKADKINAQLGRLSSVSRLFGRREIKELPNILWDDEDLRDIVQGLYDNGQGILVATTRRLVFVNKGMVYGLKVEDFSYDRVTSIQYETKMMFGTITIFGSGNKAVVSQVTPKARAKSFAESVRALISETKEPAVAAPPVAPTAPGIDPIAQLEKLAELKDRGILTEEEFAAKKKQLLGI